MGLFGGLARGAVDLKMGAMKYINKVHDPVDKAVVSGVKNSLIKKTDPHFSNGYLGYKPTALTNVAAFGAAGAYAYTKSLQVHAKPVPGQIEYENEAPIHSYDGVGGSKAPTLGASGGMVFGLNAMRRG
jgi:hypothetical protein